MAYFVGPDGAFVPPADVVRISEPRLPHGLWSSRTGD